jgi:hypothetical protein
VLVSVDFRWHGLTRGVTGFRARSVHIMDDHREVQRVRDTLTVVTSDDSQSDYGSEGWGFESLRARNIIRDVTCGNAGHAPFKTRPLWTCGAPTVLVSFGPRPSGLRCLIRLGLLAS